MFTGVTTYSNSTAFLKGGDYRDKNFCNNGEIDYYPFGMLMPNRHGQDDDYRYGFNGMEMDDEVRGTKGASYDFGARMLDVRIGRWLSGDPQEIDYPAVSPYVFALNSPLMFKDPNGEDAVITVLRYPDGGGKIIVATTVYMTGKSMPEGMVDKFSQETPKIFKPGIYVDECGEEFTVEFQVKIEYIDKKPNLDNPTGDNIMEYSDEATESSVGGRKTWDENGDEIIKTGNTGELSFLHRNDPERMAHEIFHFLGLADRYDEVKGKGRVPHKGFRDDIMSGTSDKIGQVHYDNIAEYALTQDLDKNNQFILTNRVDNIGHTKK